MANFKGMYGPFDSSSFVISINSEVLDSACVKTSQDIDVKKSTEDTNKYGIDLTYSDSLEFDAEPEKPEQFREYFKKLKDEIIREEEIARNSKEVQK